MSNQVIHDTRILLSALMPVELNQKTRKTVSCNKDTKIGEIVEVEGVPFVVLANEHYGKTLIQTNCTIDAQYIQATQEQLEALKEKAKENNIIYINLEKFVAKTPELLIEPTFSPELTR